MSEWHSRSQEVRKPINGGELEEGRERETLAELRFHFGEQADREYGMAAEIKEIIADANRFNTENRFPDADEPGLQRIPGREMAAGVKCAGPVRFRQSAPIHLSAHH